MNMTLAVEGMTCGHCARAINEAVQRLGGSAQVDLANGTVLVEGEPTRDEVVRAIEAEGYRVTDVQA